jgi:hypothetical protein
VYSSVSEAHKKSASLSNAENWYRTTGLWTVGMSAFSENYFIRIRNVKRPDDILIGEACYSSVPQAGANQKEEIESYAPSCENLTAVQEAALYQQRN